MEKQKSRLTATQKNVFEAIFIGSTLVFFKAGCSAHSHYSLERDGESTKVHMKVGDALVKSGLLKEIKRIDITKERSKIFYTHIYNN